jgi:hypothetical protein
MRTDREEALERWILDRCTLPEAEFVLHLMEEKLLGRIKRASDDSPESGLEVPMGLANEFEGALRNLRSGFSGVYLGVSDD